MDVAQLLVLTIGQSIVLTKNQDIAVSGATQGCKVQRSGSLSGDEGGCITLYQNLLPTLSLVKFCVAQDECTEFPCKMAVPGN